MKKNREDVQFSVESRKEKRQRKYTISKPHPIIYILSVLIMMGVMYHSYKLFAIVNSYTFIPAKYIKLVLWLLLGVNVFFGLIAFLPRINNLNKILQSVLCLILAFVLAQGCIILPTIKGQMERLLIGIPSEGELCINAYTKADSSIESVKDFMGKKFGMAVGVDDEAQDYAIKVIKRELKTEELDISTYEDIYLATEALYAGDIDILLLNETYADIIADNDDFLTFGVDTKVAYQCFQKIDIEYDSHAVGNITTEPFIIGVAGNDGWTLEYVNKMVKAGRTDVNMVIVVNPTTKQLLIVTLPRDSYVPIDGNKAHMDKLTHATVFSIDTWRKTLNTVLDIDINYFVRISFASLTNVVDAIGGVDIENPYYFESEVYSYYDSKTKKVTNEKCTFNQGPLHLDGRSALAYARERHYIRNGKAIGDGERNKHQSIVIKGIIDKVTSVEILKKYDTLLESVAGTFNTDLTSEQIFALVGMQLEDMCMWDMKTYSLSGRGGMYPSYAMGGRELSCIVLSDEKVAKAKNLIDKVMNNEIITDEDLVD